MRSHASLPELNVNVVYTCNGRLWTLPLTCRNNVSALQLCESGHTLLSLQLPQCGGCHCHVQVCHVRWPRRRPTSACVQAPRGSHSAVPWKGWFGKLMIACMGIVSSAVLSVLISLFPLCVHMQFIPNIMGIVLERLTQQSKTSELKNMCILVVSISELNPLPWNVYYLYRPLFIEVSPEMVQIHPWNEAAHIIHRHLDCSPKRG